MSSISPSKRPCRILVVEDYPDMSEALAVLLQAAGHEVAITRDGETALLTARRFRPDIVLSDVGLAGEMDGYELARRFKSDPGLRECYLVALTAYAYSTDVEKARDAGFEEHVAKPAAAEVVLALIERARGHIDRRPPKPGRDTPGSPGDPREASRGRSSEAGTEG